MTTEQIVETSVTVNDNNQDYVHPDDYTQLTYDNDFWVQTFHIIIIIKLYLFIIIIIIIIITNDTGKSKF